MKLEKTLLLLDDDPAFATLVRELLVSHGYRVLLVGTCYAATATLLAEVPVLAIVDGRLPDGRGREWIADARELQPQLEIIYVSATIPDARERDVLTESLGVEVILRKPVAPNELLVHVDALFERGRRERDALRQEAIDGELARLRRDYERALPELYDDLARAVERARQLGGRDDFADATLLAHRLGGTAGTFGLVKVGDEARKAEQLLESLAAGNAREDAWDAVAHCLREGRGAVGRSPSPPPR